MRAVVADDYGLSARRSMCITYIYNIYDHIEGKGSGAPDTAHNTSAQVPAIPVGVPFVAVDPTGRRRLWRPAPALPFPLSGATLWP